MTYEGSKARGLIRAAAAGLHHSCSNARAKPCLQPTPQLRAMPDPLTHCTWPGSLGWGPNPCLYSYLSHCSQVLYPSQQKELQDQMF